MSIKSTLMNICEGQQSGVDLYKISKLLGHKDIKTAQRYAHHCPESLQDGVDILEADYNREKSSNFK